MQMRSFFAMLVIAGLAGCGGSRSEVVPAPPSTVKRSDGTSSLASAKLAYPTAPTVDVVDDYHGTKVSDPYRWLEETDSDQTRAWIQAQNDITFGYLERINERAAIAERLTRLWDYEKFTTPYKEGGRYFYGRNDGLQNQDVLYWAASLDDEPKLLLDPNALSTDGTVALAGAAVSDDGKLLAYGLQSAGSDWATWHVRDIETGQDLEDKLEWIKFSGASWSKDGKGFYYSRYPTPADGSKLTGANFNHKVYYHRLGTPQSSDELIFENPAEPTWGFGADVTDDGRYLLLSIWKGSADHNLVYYKDLKKKKKLAKAGFGFVPLFSHWDASYEFVDNDGPLFWFTTDKDAPRTRLIAVDTRKKGTAAIKEIVPQATDTLRSVAMVGGKFFASYLHDAQSRIAVFDSKGKSQGEVALPGIGSAGGFRGRRQDMETFYSFTGFTTPGTIYRYDVSTGESTLYKQPKVDFDPNAYETKQVFYQSKDGTKIPMFLVHRKGIVLDGNNPTLLYGYGGFKVSLTPSFGVSKLVWLDMGGVYAVPNLRGGGEYGEQWHQAGTKLNKQNVFDDFIAAAEWLIANNYTRPEKLAINGGSNGGLLVGAAITQRPELFGAAIPVVGVMDMLRFHKFTIGWAWVDDYGSSDDPEQFKALVAYSPYHNISDGVKYPPTLVMTADHDDRVVPGHSFKFAARMQAAQAGPAPILIRVDTKAGHGGGKPTAMRIAETVDEYAFLVATLGMRGLD